MWTTKLIKKVYIVGHNNIEVEIEYSDGTNKILNTYYVKNLEEIKGLARKKIKELEDLKTNYGNFVKGSIDLTEPIPPPIVVDEDKKSFLKDLEEYKKYKTFINLGVLPLNSGSEVLDRLKLNFKPEYFDDIMY